MTVSNQQYDLMYCPLEMLSAFLLAIGMLCIYLTLNLVLPGLPSGDSYPSGRNSYPSGSSMINSDLVCLLEMLSYSRAQFNIVMYLSDIKSCVARTSIGAQFLAILIRAIGAQDAPASCYELCVK